MFSGISATTAKYSLLEKPAKVSGLEILVLYTTTFQPVFTAQVYDGWHKVQGTDKIAFYELFS